MGTRPHNPRPTFGVFRTGGGKAFALKYPPMRGIVSPHHCWLFAQPLTFGKVISTWHKIADVLQKSNRGMSRPLLNWWSKSDISIRLGIPLPDSHVRV